MQVDVVDDLRVLHLAGNMNLTKSHTERRLSKREGGLGKACPRSGTHPPTRPHLLIVPLPWETFPIKPSKMGGELATS